MCSQLIHPPFSSIAFLTYITHQIVKYPSGADINPLHPQKPGLLPQDPAPLDCFHQQEDEPYGS